MSKPYELAVVFAGHMIDAPERQTPLFPAALEQSAALAIDRDMGRIVGNHAHTVGLASAARGGDILFHEACRHRGIDTKLVLPFPPGDFVCSCVLGTDEGGWGWRFWLTWDGIAWADREVLLHRPEHRGYALVNKRLLELATSLAPNVHLLALWDGMSRDGPGGAASAVAEARAVGAEVDVIALSDLSPHAVPYDSTMAAHSIDPASRAKGHRKRSSWDTSIARYTSQRSK